MTIQDQIIQRPPGQQRSYSAPTNSGKIRFIPPNTDLECETSYSIWGALGSKRTPLICLHGGPGATSTYMKPFSLLSTDYDIPIIIYDQIGCGQSTHLRDRKGDTKFWTIDLFVAELRNLNTALNISTFDLLGHSWGGQVAARFASQHQHSGLRKLIIAQSTANIGERAPYFKQQMADLPAPFGDAARQAALDGNEDTPGYQAALAAYYRHHMCRLEPWPQEMLDCVAAMEEDDTVSSTMYGYLLEFDLKPNLRRLGVEAVPGGILVMNGRFDQSVDEVVAPFCELPSVGVERVRFERSSHMAVLEETEEVLVAVGRFLNRG